MSNNHLKKDVLPLDLPSEGIFMWEQPGFPQTDYGAFQMRGPCDIEALKEAFAEAQEEKPTFHAHLMERRCGLVYQKYWHVRGEPAELTIIDKRDPPKLPDDFEAWVHVQMREEIMRGQNLREEYAVKFKLYLLPQKYQILLFMFHHVVTDGGGLYDFLREAFRLYHIKTKNREPDWANAPAIHAQSRAQTIDPINSFRFFLRAYRANIEHPMKNVGQLAGTPERENGRSMIRCIIEDPKEQKAFRDRARADGGSLSDLFMAASKLAMQDFNDSQGVSTEILAHGLAVNMRGRLPAHEIRDMGNPMSGIVIASDRGERRDPVALLRLIAQRRRQILSEGYDIAMSRMLQSISKATRILPAKYRHPLMRLLLDWQISFFLTNLGVVWPRMENGRPTGETAVKRVGDMELVDVHSSVGPTENNGLALILRTFMGRFYCVFAVGLNKISENDARVFSKLVMKKARGYL